MSETEISNVGSRQGDRIASEATLQLLVSEFRNQSSDINKYYNKMAGEVKKNTNETNKNTKSQSAFTKATTGSAKALGRFTRELAFGGNRLGDFSNAVFGASSSLTTLTRIADGTIDMFRGLTTVGASFNNSMFEMFYASANSAMSLGDFADMVSNNSNTLAIFGSTVTAGARNLGNLSKEFRGGIGRELFGMGFTVNEVNETLISFLDIERRRNGQNLRFDRANQQAAFEFALELDKLAKVTGKQREELAKDIQTQNQDTIVRSQLNRLDEVGRKNLQSSLALIENELPSVAVGLKDLMDGTPQSEQAAALMQAAPALREFMMQVYSGGLTMQQTADGLAKFAPQIEAFSSQFDQSPELIQAMRASGGIGAEIVGVTDSLFEFNRLRGRDFAAAASEQEKRERITETLAGFENAIAQIRSNIITSFGESAGQEGGLLSAFQKLKESLIGVNDPTKNGSLPKFQEAFQNFMINAFGAGGVVTSGVNKITEALGKVDWDTVFADLEEKFNSFSGWITGLIDTASTEGFGAALKQAGSDILNAILDMFLGQRQVIGSQRDGILGDRQGGLLRTITDGIVNAIDSSGAVDFLAEIKQTINEKLFPQTSTQPFFENVKQKVNEMIFGTNARDDGTGGNQGGIIQSLSNGFEEMWQQGDLANKITGYFQDTLYLASDSLMNFWKGPAADQLTDTIGDYFQDLMIYLKTIINESGILGDYAISDRELAQEKRNLAIERLLEGKLTGTKYDDAKGFLLSDREELMRQVNEQADVLANFFKLNPDLSRGTNENNLKYMRRLETAEKLDFDQMQMMQELRTVRGMISQIPARKIGTLQATGQTTEPQSGLMNVHAGERVLNPREAAAYNQSGQDSKLDQLNNTMMQVVALLAQGNQINERAAKGLRGMTNDFYRGAVV